MFVTLVCDIQDRTAEVYLAVFATATGGKAKGTRYSFCLAGKLVVPYVLEAP